MRPEKTQLFFRLKFSRSKLFFFGLFFKKNYLRRKKMAKNRVFEVIWESSRNIEGIKVCESKILHNPSFQLNVYKSLLQFLSAHFKISKY